MKDKNMTNHIYKQFMSLRTVFCMVFALLMAIFPHNLAAQPNPAYTVEGVMVDVTAKNAVLAREKALDEAQSTAYRMLAERLLSPEEQANLKIPDPITLSSLVQDFEVVKEQASSVRYKGEYIVRFRPNAMKSKLAAEGKTFSDKIQKPVLILPVLQSGTKNILWGDGNPWMAAWRNLPSDKNTLQPTIVPLGDAQDIAQVSGDEGLLDMDSMKLQELATRYGADDVAILLATSDSAQTTQGTLAINLYKNSFEGPELVKKIVMQPLKQEKPDAFFARAAIKVKSDLRGNWKGDIVTAQPSINTAPNENKATTAPMPYTRPALGPVSTYIGVAKFSSVQDWVRLKNTLDKLYGMQTVMIKGLKPREASIDMRFAGDIRALTLALQNAGITMRGSSVGGVYELYRGASSPTAYGVYQ